MRNKGKVRMKLTRKFLEKLVLHELPQYKICWLADVNPNWLSKVRHGIDPIWGLDERIVRIARVLEMSVDDALEKVEKK